MRRTSQSRQQHSWRTKPRSIRTFANLNIAYIGFASEIAAVRHLLMAEIYSCAHKGSRVTFEGFIFQPSRRTVTPCKERRSHGVFAKAC